MSKLKYKKNSLKKSFLYAAALYCTMFACSPHFHSKKDAPAPKETPSQVVTPGSTFIDSLFADIPFNERIKPQKIFIEFTDWDSLPEGKWSKIRRFIPDSLLSIGQKDNFIKAMKENRAYDFSTFLDIYGDNFVYDTVFVNNKNVRSRMCLGQYLPAQKYVEIKHFVEDTLGYNCTADTLKFIKDFCSKYNDDYQMAVVAVHELCHKSFHEQGNIKGMTFKTKRNPDFILNFEKDTTQSNLLNIPKRKEPYKVKVFDISLEDFATINQWNEIGAEFGSLIFEREQYMKTRDIEKFVHKNTYVKSVKEGLIDPFDPSPEARKKEYALMINTMVNWWIDKKKESYAYTSLKDVDRLITTSITKNIMIPQTSNKVIAQNRVNTCLTFKIDGQWVNFYSLIDNPYLTMQPMVAKRVEEAKAFLKLFEEQTDDANAVIKSASTKPKYPIDSKKTYLPPKAEAIPPQYSRRQRRAYSGR